MTNPSPESSLCEVVVLTALRVEFEAVARHLKDVEEIVHPLGTIYYQGTFAGVHRIWRVAVAQIGMGGPTAATQTERAINYFRPQITLFVGIGGGLKDVKRGDVVAASKVYAYESGKVGPQFQPRPEVWRASYALEQRAQNEARSNEWLTRLEGSSPDPVPQVYIGALAAGEKVLASTRSELFRLLKATYGDTLAVEMEGHGFLAAVYANQSVQALVIRGISDLVDDKTEADASGMQTIVAQHAAAFAFQVLAKLKSPLPGGASSPSEAAREDMIGATQVWNVPFGVDDLPRTIRSFPLPRRTLLRLGAAGTVTVAAIGTGAFLISRLRSSPGSRVTPPVQIVTPPQGSPITSLTPTVTFTGHTGQVLSVAWSPNGKYIASAGNDKTVRVWNWEANLTASSLIYRGQPFPVLSVAWSPDSQQLVSGGGDQTVQVCTVTANDISGQIGYYDNAPDPGGYISSVSWSPDGAFIADGGFHCKVWRAGGGSPLLVYQGHSTKHVNAVAWSPDRKSEHIASAGDDQTVQVWNASDGRPLFACNHAARVLSVTWSPDGTRIASASEDGTVQVWDARNAGRHLLTPQKSSDVVYGVSWSPDGKWLASANNDGTVRVWDANTPGENLRTYQNTYEVYAVSWSPDSKRIVAGVNDGIVQVWPG